MTPEPAKCSCGCEDHEIVLDRNRYFTGKYMRARDFAADQDYFLDRHRLHNRLLHGWGIVCGLEVSSEKRSGCPVEIVVEPGIAIDCCGRELILQPLHRLAVEIPEPKASRGKAESNDHEQRGPSKPWSGRKFDSYDDLPQMVVCIEYCETATEHVPVLGNDAACSHGETQPNRIREGVHVRLRPLDELTEECWTPPSRHPSYVEQQPARQTHQGEPHNEPSVGCLLPSCPCGGCVPVAVVTVDKDGELVIDQTGRRQLVSATEPLTHISHINWVHGGEIPINQLRDDMNGELRVTFSAPLRAKAGLATGVNGETFVVQHHGETLALEFVDVADDSFPLVEEECIAVFKMHPLFLEPNRGSPVNSVVNVALYGDFILDEAGRPVDLDHLRGTVPSGNALAGGVFRSWFVIGPESAQGSSI